MVASSRSVQLIPIIVQTVCKTRIVRLEETTATDYQEAPRATPSGYLTFGMGLRSDGEYLIHSRFDDS